MKNNRQGFSLVEVVLVMGLVAMCITPLLGLLSIATVSTAETIQQLEAANIASKIKAQMQLTATNNTTTLLQTSVVLPSTNSSILCDALGQPPTAQSPAKYQLLASISTDGTSPVPQAAFLRTYVVNLRVMWPVGAAKPANSYEQVFSLSPNP